MAFFPRLRWGRPREIDILEGTKDLERRVSALQGELNEREAEVGRLRHIRREVAAAVAGVALMLGLTLGFGLGVYHEPIGGFVIGLAQNVGLVGNVPVDPEIAAKRHNYRTALRLVRPRAENGDARSQFVLGRLYYDGNGRNTQDYDRAVKWFRRAADQGNASAQLYLGLMSHEGQGVPQDYAEAAEWYRRAAEQGEVHAQYNLGIYYATGKAGPVDNVSAYMWLSLASAHAPARDRGNRLTIEARDQVAKMMTPDQIAEAQRRAREWKPK